jgi:hypothetical protein
MANLSATPPQCSGGKLCTVVRNDDDSPVTVTVDIFVCDEHLKQDNVTIPAHDSVQVCVQPVTVGDCVVSVEVKGEQLAKRVMKVPC